MDNIIKFPTTTEKEYLNGTKVAREAFDPASLET